MSIYNAKQSQAKMPVFNKSHLQYKTTSHMKIFWNVTIQNEEQKITYAEFELLSINFCLENPWLKTVGMTLFQFIYSWPRCTADNQMNFGWQLKILYVGQYSYFIYTFLPEFNSTALNSEQILMSIKLQAFVPHKKHIICTLQSCRLAENPDTTHAVTYVTPLQD